MNAIVALCHFCELHGPSVVFCTQSFHDPDDPQKMLDECPQAARASKKYYGKTDIFQRSLSASGTGGETDGAAVKSKNSDTCEACRSIPLGTSGFISNDHEAQVSYISTQYPFHPEIFSIVRQACVRSLSCEVCPGREGPIFFGDEDRGHIYSHTFFVKDSQARGFQRWYSIIVVMMDKTFLLNSWPFLTKHLRTVIDELQEKANRLYQIEQTESPQRVARLNTITSMTPGNFRQQRGSSKSMRPLQELTNDKDVFSGLHLWFTWILKAGGNRMTEKLLEGPPTEDTVIDLEKLEETEEGFTVISTKKIPRDSIAPAAVEHSMEPKSAKEGLALKVTIIRHLRQILGPEKFHVLAHHVIVGNQIIVMCDDPDLVYSIFNSLKIILPRGCINEIPYSERYVDSYKCNFLGLPKSTPLPENVVRSSLHLVVEISPKDEQKVVAADPLEYNYDIRNYLLMPEKGSTVLHRMEKIIENKEFSERVLEVYFMTMKEEWMNKVKVLFKFSRTGCRSVEETHKLFQVLGAHERDKQVLKFWMTGLSTQYKTHVLSAPMSQCHGNEGTVS